MNVVVASDAALEREQLRQAVLGLGLECTASDCVGVADLPARLQAGSVGMALIAIGIDHAAALVAVHRAADISKLPIYAVCDHADGTILPALIRAGVKGYLRRDEVRSDLLAAVQELKASGTVNVNWGRVIAVCGGLPGVGVTTVATNLAFALAAKAPGRVALAQLTDGVPDLALNLDLKPAYPLAELAAGWYRLDSSLMSRCLVEHPAGVSILADQPGVTGPVSWKPAALRQVLVLLRARFDAVVVDLGHTVDPARIEGHKFADAAAVVLRLDIPAVRIGRQFLWQLSDAGLPSSKLVGVVNRFGQKEQLPWKQAREALNIDIGEFVPDDAAHLNHALNTGRPLVSVAKSAAITESFAKLASRWAIARPTPRRVLSGAG